MKILRYKNRKLFIARRGYVNGDFILNLVRNDEEFSIVEHQSGKDVTLQNVCRLLVEAEDYTTLVDYLESKNYFPKLTDLEKLSTSI